MTHSPLLHRHERHGFTIVELLIVIVVIAVLAAITIVAYNGIQSRANDTRIKQTAAQIEKSINLWEVDTGILPAAGWGSTAAASNDSCPGTTSASGGWFQSGLYLCSMQDLLRARGYLTNNLATSLPKNSKPGYDSNYVFMFYPCNNISGSYVLMWNLSSPSADDTTKFNTIAQTCYGIAATAMDQYISYGMRAGDILSLR